MNLHSLHISRNTDAEITVTNAGYCKKLEIRESSEGNDSPYSDIFEIF